MSESMSGKLVGIAIRAKSRAPMVELEEATITNGEGVVGDFRGKPGPRQVTVISVEDWSAACAELGKSIPWTTRRANLLVEGFPLFETTDSVLRIGKVELRVSGETCPCSRMDESVPGLREALTPSWRGGVTCRVIRGGVLVPGDSVTLEVASASGP